jgi:hypothetical protein
MIFWHLVDYFKIFWWIVVYIQQNYVSMIDRLKKKYFFYSFLFLKMFLLLIKIHFLKFKFSLLLFFFRNLVFIISFTKQIVCEIVFFESIFFFKSSFVNLFHHRIFLRLKILLIMKFLKFAWSIIICIKYLTFFM